MTERTAEEERAAVKVRRLAEFMGEQEEREAVVAWLRKVGDSKPHGTDWRTYYEIADAIELGAHRDAALPIEETPPMTQEQLSDAGEALDPNLLLEWIERDSWSYPHSPPAMRSAIRAALALAEQRGRQAAVRYRHKKRGTVYEVIGEAEVQNAGGYAISEGDKLVIYRGEDGHLWARWTYEFLDGRFEEVAARKDG